MRRLYNGYILALVVMLFLVHQDAYAYINPGTGSYLFQTVIGGILGVLILFKNFFKAIFNFITGKRSEGKDLDEDE